MGLLTWIKDRVRNSLVKYGGTITTTTDDDRYPIAIANELLGGQHGYRNLEELASIPVSRLNPPMSAIVREHELEDGTIFPTTVLIFDPSDDDWNALLAYERLIDMPDYDISRYWKTQQAAAQTEDEQVQFAPEVDYGNGPEAPAFLPPRISSENYQAGYKSDDDHTVIWSDTYDPTIHVYMRQRRGENSKWGIPVKFAGEAYEAGDYIDNRFMWVEKGVVPPTPPMLVNGQPNNEPDGWHGTPEILDTGSGEGEGEGEPIDYYDYISTHDLYRTSAHKDSYQNLKSGWSVPKLISTDPTLVRYGNKPSSTNYIGPNGEDTEDWRGYYTPGLDTHQAVRETSQSPWRIYNIDNEEGEYVDYIFKAFPVGYEPTDADRPTVANPFGEGEYTNPNVGWSDGPFDPGPTNVLYKSVGRKYNNGDLKPSGWSIPTRVNGEDIVQVVIEPQTSNVFKYASDLSVTPAQIVVKARFYRGLSEITDNFTVRWFKGAYNPEDESNEILKGSSVGVSEHHTISGDHDEILTIEPDAVDSVQLYTVRVFFQGEDYIDTITILDVSDAQGLLAVIESDGGFVFKNASGSITFTGKLYNNGVHVTDNVEYKWLLGNTDITPGSDKHEVTVSGSDFEDKEILKLEVTYGGQTYTRTETLVDLSDAEEVKYQWSSSEAQPDEFTEWSGSPIDAVWARVSTDGGETWSAAFRVRGESAPFNGGFYRDVFKNSATKPTATGLTSNLLPQEEGWTDTITEPEPGETVWRAVAFFLKKPYNEDGTPNNNIELTTDNWAIQGTWSDVISMGNIPTAGSGEGEGGVGEPGPPGPIGWSPVPGIIADGSRRIVRIVDWINEGGAPQETKPQTGYYLSPNGFVTNPAQATDIRGPQGANGQFSADDFWETPTYRINGSNGSPNHESWDVRFRRAKNGLVYYSGRHYRGGGGSRVVDFKLSGNWMTFMIPAQSSFSAGVSNPVMVCTNSQHFDSSGNPGGTDGHARIVRIGSDYYLRLRFVGGWTNVFEGVYPTITVFNE